MEGPPVSFFDFSNNYDVKRPIGLCACIYLIKVKEWDRMSSFRTRFDQYIYGFSL
jgi:hypothetical protein